MSKAEEKPVSEYGEPWRHNTFWITNASGEVVEDGDQNQFTLEELDRIVACVNALAGIPNPEAVRELVEAAKEWASIARIAESEDQIVRSNNRLYDAVQSLSAPSTGAQQK